MCHNRPIMCFNTDRADLVVWHKCTLLYKHLPITLTFSSPIQKYGYHGLMVKWSNWRLALKTTIVLIGDNQQMTATSDTMIWIIVYITLGTMQHLDLSKTFSVKIQSKRFIFTHKLNRIYLMVMTNFKSYIWSCCRSC